MKESTTFEWNGYLDSFPNDYLCQQREGLKSYGLPTTSQLYGD